MQQSLKGAERKTGLNLQGPCSFEDFEIVEGNANCMDFEDESFDAVLCNALLEHDRGYGERGGEIRHGAPRVIGVGTKKMATPR